MKFADKSSGSHLCKTHPVPSLELLLDVPPGVQGESPLFGLITLGANSKNLSFLVLLTFSPGNIVFKSYPSKGIYSHLLMLKCHYGQVSSLSEHCWKDPLFAISARAAPPMAAPLSLPGRCWWMVLPC